MTRRDTLQSVHEPFGDAFYYGPEMVSDRFKDDDEYCEATGFSSTTYKDVLDSMADAGKDVSFNFFSFSIDCCHVPM
jgi:hypothetical protein